MILVHHNQDYGLFLSDFLVNNIFYKLIINVLNLAFVDGKKQNPIWCIITI